MKTLKITQDAWNLLMAYGLSEREILFLGAGKSNTICHIERVPNSARGGRHQAEWSDEDYYFARKEVAARGLNVLCEGHSHPSPRSLRHPSEIDVKNIPEGTIELIVFPTEKAIRGWIIRKSIEQTLKNEVRLVLVSASTEQRISD